MRFFILLSPDSTGDQTKPAMPPSKNVVFDVVGTLVGYDELYKAIEERLGEKLLRHNVKSDMFGYMWVRQPVRDSISDRHLTPPRSKWPSGSTPTTA